MEKWLTYEQAAAHAQARPSTVKGWVKQGRLRAFGSGKLHRIALSDLDAFLRENCVPERQRRSA